MGLEYGVEDKGRDGDGWVCMLAVMGGKKRFGKEDEILWHLTCLTLPF